VVSIRINIPGVTPITKCSDLKKVKILVLFPVTEVFIKFKKVANRKRYPASLNFFDQ